MRTLLPIVFAFLLIFYVNPVNSQVSGCKDPAAINYNSSATVNDGSCTYSTTFYSPPVKVDPISSVLIETSGLQIAGNFLWSFNDGGNAPAIYRMDTTTDAILQTVNLDGVSNIDWEDIAFDGTHFYIGDFGNNANGARADLKIYKFPFSAIPSYTTDPVATISSAGIEVISFTYSDQVPVTPTSANSTRWDCEAMIVEGGQIHLFSKNWIDLNTTHYVINGVTAGVYAATPLETLATSYLVTGADRVPAGNMIALLGYQTSGFGNHFMHLLSDFSSGLYFNGNKRMIDLPNAGSMGQAEGICFRNNSYGYISNERITSPIVVSQKLRSFNTESFVPNYVLPLDLIHFNVSKTSSGHQITWSFASPIKGLKILHSHNRVDFIEVQAYSTSTNGVAFNAPSTASSCYKLVWQQPGGGEKYSNTVCVSNETRHGLRNIVLDKNGGLNFILNGNEPVDYLFRLVTTDGKVVAQTPRKRYGPGACKINFARQLHEHSVLFLQVVGDTNHTSILLSVEQ